MGFAAASLNNSQPGLLASVELLPLAARTAAPTVPTFDIVNHSGRVLLVWVNVTAVVDTPGLTITIKGKDPVVGTLYTILTSATYATTGLRRLLVTPDLVAAAGLTAQDVVPQELQILVAHGDADSITYSLSATLLPG